MESLAKPSVCSFPFVQKMSIGNSDYENLYVYYGIRFFFLWYLWQIVGVNPLFVSITYSVEL